MGNYLLKKISTFQYWMTNDTNSGKVQSNLIINVLFSSLLYSTQPGPFPGKQPSLINFFFSFFHSLFISKAELVLSAVLLTGLADAQTVASSGTRLLTCESKRRSVKDDRQWRGHRTGTWNTNDSKLKHKETNKLSLRGGFGPWLWLPSISALRCRDTSHHRQRFSGQK